MKRSKIDHIVYASPNLERTVRSIEKRLGVKVYPGGRHLDFGTHNALINMGNGIYFEIISSDPTNYTHKGPLWMGINYLDESPRLTRYALKKKITKSDLQLLSDYKKELDLLSTGRRLRPDGSFLEWTLTVPHSDPLIEACPFLIDWPEGIHPTLSLPQECQLKSFTIFTPDVDAIRKITESLDAEIIVIHDQEQRLEAIIQCPLGDVTIS